MSNPPLPARTSHISDSELLDACRSGSEEAWEELVRRYGPLIYTVPSRLGLPSHGRDEVFQSVFAELVRQASDLSDPGSLAKWLIVVARRECHRWASTERRQAEAAWRPPGSSPAVEDEMMEALERQHAVQRAMSRLDEGCQELLHALFRPSGSTAYRQISKELGMPIGSIGPNRARCLKKLAELYQRQHADSP